MRVTGSFEHPDEVREVGGVRQEFVRVGDGTISRTRNEVGWRWSKHIKPIVGTEWCQVHHRGVILSGRLGVEMQDGTIHEIGPGCPFDIPPGHDGWVIGDEPVVEIEWVGATLWTERQESARLLATLLFEDIVDSTASLASLGDKAWRGRLAAHDEMVKRVLDDAAGVLVKTTGDGFLARFDGPARALRAARRIREGVVPLGLRVRQGVHVGEVQVVPGDLAGLAVHEAARVAAAAGPGEILASQVTRVLATGFRFAERGSHVLKGIDGPRELFALADD